MTKRQEMNQKRFLVGLNSGGCIEANLFFRRIQLLTSISMAGAAYSSSVVFSGIDLFELVDIFVFGWWIGRKEFMGEGELGFLARRHAKVGCGFKGIDDIFK